MTQFSAPNVTQIPSEKMIKIISKHRLLNPDTFFCVLIDQRCNDNIHVSITFFHIIPPSPSHT